MPKKNEIPEQDTVLVGWQGITAEVPENWNVGAISGDSSSGYVRYDDERMPRLEVKWASEKGFVDLNSVIDKYLKDVQKGKKSKKDPDVKVERDIALTGKGKRKKSGLKCFHWVGEVEGYGAAWICKDCGRTMIAQVTLPAEMDENQAKQFAGSVLLSIEDHPTDGWVLWSAYGFGCYIPEDFHISGQKLMAGLIEFEFEKETEKIRVARWGMANVALKKLSLQEWIGKEMAKELRKHDAKPEVTEIKGHEAIDITGSSVAGMQLVQRFYAHCTSKLYADHLIARAWHCEPENKIYYVQTFVDRENVEFADELVARIECHPDCNNGAE